MIWTSITSKIHHLIHIALSYLGYESNPRLPLLILKLNTLLFLSLVLTTYI